MTTHHRIKSLAVATALALGTGAPPASAWVSNLNAQGSEVPALSAAGQTPSNPASAQPTIVRVSAPNGFDWGDAGIGAAGAVAISMLGLGGALALSGRRTRRPAARRA
jgi:hypothetical protein